MPQTLLFSSTQESAKAVSRLQGNAQRLCSKTEVQLLATSVVQFTRTVHMPLDCCSTFRGVNNKAAQDTP